MAAGGYTHSLSMTGAEVSYAIPANTDKIVVVAVDGDVDIRSTSASTSKWIQFTVPNGVVVDLTSCLLAGSTYYFYGGSDRTRLGIAYHTTA